ncbi:MAG TPA: hypothetical protein VHC21_00830 [Candidatus Saccharimonadales bacterium]|nr:hypothetical protein [Candidatus Saccharimonadales bacterium]
MANSSPVYDDDDQKPITRPDLRQLEEGVRSSSGSKRAKNEVAGGSKQASADSETQDDDGFYNPSGDEVRKNSAIRANLALAEFSGAAKAGLFNPEDKNNAKLGIAKPIKRALRDRKKVALAGGATAGVATIVVAGFLMLVPLKIEHIVTNLQDHFMGTSNSAVEEETQTLFKGYMKKVLPAYKSCGTTRSKNCTPKDFGDGPIGSLYRTWSNARLENKLADDYGLEFQYKNIGGRNTWVMKTSSNSAGINIGEDGSGLDQEFNSRSEARKAITAYLDDALEGETKWKSVMIRYKTGRLLEEKYGLRRCMIFCGVTDPLQDKVDAKKKAAQLYLVQKVLKPRTDTMGTVLECLLDTSCDPNKTDPQQAQEGSNAEEGGAPESSVQETIQQDGQQAVEEAASETADQLTSDYNTISEKGFQAYLIEKVLEKVGLAEISDKVTTAVPIVGWANQAASMITAINHAGPKLKALAYIANSGAAVQLYMMYRSYADEIHTGHADATEVGSMVNSLGDGNNGAASDPEVGGTASAENTPLYQSLIDGNNTGTVNSQASLLSGLLPGKAYADSTSSGDSTTTSNQYKCNDGSAPSGLVCSEEVLGTGNSLADGAHTALNTPPLSVITGVAGFWSSTVGKVFGTVGSWISGAIEQIPGVTPAMDSISGFVSGVIQPFQNFLVNQLIPNPFGSNMSGGRTFDLMAAGADVAGNDNAHTELGGHVLTPQQAADIMSQQENEAKQQFDNQPFFARMFSTDSQYSLISKVAMDMPLSKQAAVQTSFASILNPLSSITHGFGSLFSGKASADPQDCAMSPAVAGTSTDCLGVTPQGWTPDEIAALGDAQQQQAYWDANCNDNASDAYMNNNTWNEEAATSKDPASGMPQNTTGNECLLIKNTVGSSGGYMDTSNLTSDDLADENGSGSSTGTNPPTTGVSGNGSGQFTTDTSHPAYPGLQQMLAEVEKVGKTQNADTAAFCASIGGCSGKCESAVEMAWLGHRGQYADPFGNPNPNGPPGPDSAWAAALASGHAHPGDRNPPVGALLIYTIPGDQYGHITIYLGNNLVFSTDFNDPGSVGIQPASAIETASWAHSYVGWMDPLFSGKVGNVGQ